MARCQGGQGDCRDLPEPGTHDRGVRGCFDERTGCCRSVVRAEQGSSPTGPDAERDWPARWLSELTSADACGYNQRKVARHIADAKLSMPMLREDELAPCEPRRAGRVVARTVAARPCADAGPGLAATPVSIAPGSEISILVAVPGPG